MGGSHVWDLLKLAAVVLLIVAIIVLAPLALIWAMNTLFGLGIAYTFKTWVACGLLAAAVKGNVVKHSRE